MCETRTSVFSPEFLSLASQREASPTSTPEAVWAGPWHVVCRGEDYTVAHEGGEPEAVVSYRETALLLAAVLPGCGRGPLYWLGESEETGAYPFPLLTVMGTRGLDSAGRLRHRHDELLVALSTAEYFLRSPMALSYLLEAASAEVLQRADAELARRLHAEPGPRAEDEFCPTVGANR